MVSNWWYFMSKHLTTANYSATLLMTNFMTLLCCLVGIKIPFNIHGCVYVSNKLLLLMFYFCLYQGNPTSEQKTVTANIGDSVILEVTPTSTDKFNWQKDGNVQNQWDNLKQVPLNQVKVTDAGIYECHVAGNRASGEQAIIRLIVRGKHPKTLNIYLMKDLRHNTSLQCKPSVLFVGWFVSVCFLNAVFFLFFFFFFFFFFTLMDIFLTKQTETARKYQPCLKRSEKKNNTKAKKWVKVGLVPDTLPHI